MRKLGCPAPILHWRPPPDELPIPEFKRLLEWWQEERGEECAPSPDKVDPIALAKSLGNLILTEVLNEGQDFHVRLFGSKISDNVQDLTGERLTEIWTPLRHYFMINYRAICIRPQPLYSKHTPPMNINVSGWDRLILPLVKDGEVSRILIGIYECDRQDTE